MSRSPRVHSAARAHRKIGHPAIHVWHDIIVGLSIVVVLVGIKMAFEKTVPGELADQASYEFLQHRLALGASSAPLPVTIVDITAMPDEESGQGSEHGFYKRRDKLLKLIQAIAKKEPRAIGVDIEFSPRVNHQPETPGDPAFFAACMDVVKMSNVPVYLAVFRGAAAPASAGWLGLDDFKDLAANAVIPFKRNTPTLVRFSRVKADPLTPKLSSMSDALAGAYRKKADQAAEEKSWLHLPELLFEEEKPYGNAAFDTGEYLVDYSTVTRLRDGAISAVDASDVENQADKLKDRVVLLGNADFDNLPSDTFILPGEDQPVPGVYVHAAGTITLVDGPLFDVTWWGQLMLDLVFASMVIGMVAIVRVHFERSGTEISESRLEVSITLAAIIVVIVLGAVMVHQTRILWTDFLLVALSLGLHPIVEREAPDLLRGLIGIRSMATANEKEEK